MMGKMTRLHCQIESTCPITVVRLSGALELAATPTAWTALVKLLADQPDALVIDLSDITFDDPQALLVFGALGRRASLWPGVPVILNAPDRRLRDDLHRQGIERVVAVCPDMVEAMLLAGGAPTPRRLRESLQPVAGAARRGRDLATEACLLWRSPELVPQASVIASELVTNAVCHAGTPFELSLARTTRYLHIGVRDEDPRPAVRQDPDALAFSGRGLLIVEQTALSWGSTPAKSGKVVWATLPAR
jgi:anti-anti-sigma regulatory factor